MERRKVLTADELIRRRRDLADIDPDALRRDVDSVLIEGIEELDLRAFPHP